MKQNEKDRNHQNFIGYFYILNNLITKIDKNEEDDIVNLYSNLSIVIKMVWLIQ